jgi:hypothetical protein
MNRMAVDWVIKALLNRAINPAGGIIQSLRCPIYVLSKIYKSLAMGNKSNF